MTELPLPAENPTTSFWLSTENEYLPQLTHNTTTELPQTTEVLIIGAGMAGMSTAYWLAKNESISHITILDARTIGGGATGRNGGHCWPDPLWNSFEYQLACVQLMEDYLKENNLEEIVQFKKTGGVTLLYSQEEVDENFECIDFYKDQPGMFTRFDSTERAGHSNLFKMPFMDGFLDSNAAQFWPAKYLFTLKKMLVEMAKVNIQTHTPVNRVIEDNGSYIIETNRGNIRATNVVYATNAYMPHLVPEMDGIIIPVRGQIVLTSPLPPIYTRSIAFGDYDYCIQRQDGRLVLGGKRWDGQDGHGQAFIYNDSEIEPGIGQALRGWLQNMFGIDLVKDKEELIQTESDLKCYIEREWTGIMGFTRDILPLIGRWKEHGDGAEYVLGGFNGSGMTHCFKAGQDIANLIDSRKRGDNTTPEYLRMFDPRRKQPKDMPIHF